jgi:hypothetical protein
LVVFFGQFFENLKSRTNSWATCFHGASDVLIVTKNGLGYILGDFFTNSPGHPGVSRKIGRAVKLVFFVKRVEIK